MSSFTYPKSHHLLDGKQFDRVFGNALRISGQYFTLLYIENDFGHPRLGFVISKKNAKLAVSRNRAKRVIRESFRINQDKIGAYDIVVLGRRGIGNLTHLKLHQLISKQWLKITQPNCN